MQNWIHSLGRNNSQEFLMDFEFIEDICTDPISVATLNCTDASELEKTVACGDGK